MPDYGREIGDTIRLFMQMGQQQKQQGQQQQYWMQRLAAEEESKRRLAQEAATRAPRGWKPQTMEEALALKKAGRGPLVQIGGPGSRLKEEFWMLGEEPTPGGARRIKGEKQEVAMRKAAEKERKQILTDYSKALATKPSKSDPQAKERALGAFARKIQGDPYLARAIRPGKVKAVRGKRIAVPRWPLGKGRKVLVGAPETEQGPSVLDRNRLMQGLMEKQRFLAKRGKLTLPPRTRPAPGVAPTPPTAQPPAVPGEQPPPQVDPQQQQLDAQISAWLEQNGLPPDPANIKFYKDTYLRGQ